MSFFGKPSGEEPRITFERIDLSAAPLTEPPPAAPSARERMAGATAPAVMLVAAGSEIEGQLRSRGTVRVEGVLRGTVDAPLLLLEPGGVVEGTVTAGRVRLSGRLHGTVVAEEVEVARTAILDAELVYDEISIERGARVRGLHRQRDPAPQPEVEAEAEAEEILDMAMQYPPLPETSAEISAPVLMAAAATAALVAEAEAALQDLAEASHAAAAAASELAEEGVLELAGLEADLRATPERMLGGAAAA